MFVKIIRDVKSSNSHETVYECCRVSLCDRPREQQQPEPKIPQSMLILDVGAQDERTIYLERDNLELIYMNNQGKTIDRKVW